MFCMRCGKEIKDGHIFCSACQDIMKAHPIPAGTPVQLPQRTASGSPKRRSSSRERKPEEQIHRLRSAVRWLTLGLVVATLAFAFTAVILLRQIDEDAPQEPPKGQNYSTQTEEP